jgi:hypothetical protein
MVLARSAGRVGNQDASPTIEPSILAKVQPVCGFVNAELTRLRNQTIGIPIVSAVATLLLCMVTGVGDIRVPLLVGGGAFAVCFVRARMELASAYTNIVAKRLVAALGKGLTYKTASSLTRQQFIATDLFSSLGDRWRSHDEIGGKVGAVRYSLHQVRAAGRDRGSAVFNGMIIKVDFNDNFPGHTVIVPDREGQTAGSNANAGSRIKRDLVMLKNPAFERVFSVYSSDYYEARRLVTPKLMELVMEASKQFTDVRLAFVQKSLFIAVAGEMPRPEATLFGAPFTPNVAVGKLVPLVAFAEGLASSLARTEEGSSVPLLA